MSKGAQKELLDWLRNANSIAVEMTLEPRLSQEQIKETLCRLVKKFYEFRKRANDLLNPREIYENNLQILTLVQEIRDFDPMKEE